MKYFRILEPIADGFADKFSKFLEQLSPGEPYGIEVNSPGGSVDQGMFALRKMSARPPAQALVHQAASMAALLVQTATRRVMAKDGHMILHAPVATLSGDAAKLKQAGDYVAEIEQEMVSIYEKRSHDADIKGLMRSEKPVAVQEAISSGLIDEIACPLEMAAYVAETQPERKMNKIMTLVAKILGIAEDKLGDETNATALLEAKAATIEAFEKEQARLKNEFETKDIIAKALASGRMTEAMSKLEAILKLDSRTLAVLVDSLPVVVPLARADISGLPKTSEGAITPEALKIFALLRTDPVAASKIPVPLDGVFKHIVHTK